MATDIVTDNRDAHRCEVLCPYEIVNEELNDLKKDIVGFSLDPIPLISDLQVRMKSWVRSKKCGSCNACTDHHAFPRNCRTCGDASCHTMQQNLTCWQPRNNVRRISVPKVTEGLCDAVKEQIAAKASSEDAACSRHND